ncbi:alanine racemase [Microbacterium sorbitolivorans]|uniref:Alanine racemase n=1 Tax=Microbacterium sorbitolivorans TaxID=1867410 RepID=A0A367Y856_9MICO|nr:alanine racemase [Microbacterium sorbitolivorans]RCK61790.1 alanine racemase [Microbacterium sorbitolivorans]GGF29139.1 alanine racemase [Microbacterium sorbitolivorans]
MSAELRVDLDQFRTNVRAVRRRMAPAEVLVVIKDDAYAQGVEPIVGAALEAGAMWFGGIDIPSAVRAKRVAGDRARVFCWMTVSEDEARTAIAEGLELGVGDAAYLERIAAVGGTATVHLKIDTGLHRNGVRPEQWRAFCARAAELEAEGRIRVAGVWSHIAEASDRDDDIARAQFDAAVGEAWAAGLAPEIRHLAASAAAWHRPEFRYELVRIGAFCYGVRSADGPDIPGIAPISSLVARVSAVGDDVTIDLGSVDGYPSALAGRARVATPAGARALLRVDPFSSRVEAWEGAAVGDEVTLFGPGSHGEPTPTDLGEALDTVGEEPLLRVSPLVTRVYTG